MSHRTTLACWVEAAGRCALRRQLLREPATGEVELRTQFSGISPGTERLVGLGRVSATSGSRMACAGQQGTFALPISYGYSLVGTIVDGPMAGRLAFTMHPHHAAAVVAAERVLILPDSVPPPRATLLPNLETALNAVWDAELEGNEPVAVIGAGAVGLLVSFVLSRLHRGPVTLVEAAASRRELASNLPWTPRANLPEALARDHYAVVFHCSGSGSGLQLALDALGFEGRVIELCWYGDQAIQLELGGRFHPQRHRIVASQVGTIARSHRAAGHAARTAEVLALLAQPSLDALLDRPVPFAELPEFFDFLYRGEVVPPCPLVAYPES